MSPMYTPNIHPTSSPDTRDFFAQKTYFAYELAVYQKNNAFSCFIAWLFTDLLGLALHPATASVMALASRQIFAWGFLFFHAPRSANTLEQMEGAFVHFYMEKLLAQYPPHLSEDQQIIVMEAERALREALRNRDCPLFHVWERRPLIWKNWVEKQMEHACWAPLYAGMTPHNIPNRQQHQKEVQTQIIQKANQLRWQYRLRNLGGMVHKCGTQALSFAQLLPAIAIFSLSFSLRSLGTVIVGLAVALYAIHAIAQLCSAELTQYSPLSWSTWISQAAKIHHVLTAIAISAGYLAWVFMPSPVGMWAFCAHWLFPLAMFQNHMISGFLDILRICSSAPELIPPPAFISYKHQMVDAIVQVISGICLCALFLAAPPTLVTSLTWTCVIFAIGSALTLCKGYCALYQYKQAKAYIQERDVVLERHYYALCNRAQDAARVSNFQDEDKPHNGEVSGKTVMNGAR